jgi:hypothetical protein
MRLQAFAATCVLLVASLSSAAHAAPITYTLSGTFSGSVGGTAVTDAQFKWTVTADTKLAMPDGTGAFLIPAITSTIDVSGIGTLMTTIPYEAGAAPSEDLMGFIDQPDDQGILFGGAIIDGYDGLSPLATQHVEFDQVGPVSTDHGDFVIDSTPSDTIDLTVTGGNVPEPATFVLAAAGLAGIAAMRRRRKVFN